MLSNFSATKVLLKTKKPSNYYSFFLKEVFFCTFAWKNHPFSVNSMFRIRSIRSTMVYLLIFFSTFIPPALPFGQLQAQTKEYPVVIVNGTHYYEYTVQPREGFFRLRVNFNLSEDEIIKHNPHAKDGLQVGMKILIPVPEDQLPHQQSLQKYIEHVVQKKQTLFRIRKMYSITEDELLAHNPFLNDRSLREGDVLKIPVKAEEKQVYEKPVPANGDRAVKKADTLATTRATPPATRARKQQFRIAILLPFMLDQRHEASDSRFVEFYAGALLAIHEAKAKGRQIEVFTFDTEKSDLRLMEILTDTSMKKVDLIVGPAYSNQVPLVCDFARIHKIKTIIPFTSRIFDLEANEYIYQFNPGQETELHKLHEVIRSDYSAANLIFVENPYVAANDESNQLVSQLKVLLRNTGRDFRSLTVDPSNNTAIRSAINPKKENVYIFNTNRMNTLSGQLRQLVQLSDSFQVKIYEPYAWRTAKADKPASFYLSIFRNEYPEQEYEAYMQLFGSVFNWLPVTEHPRYDLLGYDLLKFYFSSADVPRENRKLGYPRFEGLQSTIQFEKVSEKGGYINKQLNHYE